MDLFPLFAVDRFSLGMKRMGIRNLEGSLFVLIYRERWATFVV